MKSLRAWDDVAQKMLYAKPEQFDDMLGYRFEGHFETEKPVYMWGTGITDLNGKEIYENATVLITGTQELGGGLTFDWNEKAVVKWSDEECGFYLDVIKKREVGLCQDGYFTVDTFPLRKWEEGEWDIEYEVVEG